MAAVSDAPAKLLPAWMSVIKPKSFIKLRNWGEKVIEEQSDVFKTRLPEKKSMGAFVEYLNDLSEAVRVSADDTAGPIARSVLAPRLTAAASATGEPDDESNG